MGAKVTIKKWNGDDAYSWAVFVDGKVLQSLSGLNRSQAGYYRKQVISQLASRVKK